MFQEVNFYPPIISSIQNNNQLQQPQVHPRPATVIPKRRNSSINRHSQMRNLVKGTVITIKKMMNSFVMDLPANLKNQIIRQAWKVFMKNRHYNKQILMVMFNNEESEPLMNKYGFSQILKKYKMMPFKTAMMGFKVEMGKIMSNESVRLHILNRRKVKRKIRLTTFIHHFMMRELAKGIIRHRPSMKEKRMRERMLKHARQEQVHVRGLFDDQQGSQRLTSHLNKAAK